jgi:hypothetical protein
MKSIRLVYIVLFLIIAGLGCQPKETELQRERINPFEARGKVRGRTLLHLAPNKKVVERLINEGIKLSGF